jgi:hypothetical protein
MKEQDKNEELIGVPLQELWNIKQVSNFLGVPVGTLYQWRHKVMDHRPGVSVARLGTTRPRFADGSSRKAA